jgi:hypothetical protein
MNVSVKKTVAFVLALAMLQNHCIDNGVSHCDVSYSSAADEWRNEVNSAVPLVETQHAESSRDVSPRQLLDDRGHYFDDIGMNGRYNRQRRYNCVSQIGGIALPDQLHSFVASTGLTRPVLQPNGWALVEITTCSELLLLPYILNGYKVVLALRNTSTMKCYFYHNYCHHSCCPTDASLLEEEDFPAYRTPKAAYCSRHFHGVQH